MSRKHNLPSHMALTLSENYVKQMHILNLFSFLNAIKNTIIKYYIYNIFLISWYLTCTEKVLNVKVTHHIWLYLYEVFLIENIQEYEMKWHVEEKAISSSLFPS